MDFAEPSMKHKRPAPPGLNENGGLDSKALNLSENAKRYKLEEGNLLRLTEQHSIAVEGNVLANLPRNAVGNKVDSSPYLPSQTPGFAKLSYANINTKFCRRKLA